MRHRGRVVPRAWVIRCDTVYVTDDDGVGDREEAREFATLAAAQEERGEYCSNIRPMWRIYRRGRRVRA